MSLFNFDNFCFPPDYLDSNVINLDGGYPVSPTCQEIDWNLVDLTDTYFNEALVEIDSIVPNASKSNQGTLDWFQQDQVTTNDIELSLPTFNDKSFISPMEIQRTNTFQLDYLCNYDNDAYNSLNSILSGANGEISCAPDLPSDGYASTSFNSIMSTKNDSKSTSRNSSFDDLDVNSKYNPEYDLSGDLLPFLDLQLFDDGVFTDTNNFLPQRSDFAIAPQSNANNVCKFITNHSFELKPLKQPLHQNRNTSSISNFANNQMKVVSRTTNNVNKITKRYGGKRERSTMSNKDKLEKIQRFKVKSLFADIVAVNLTTANCLSCKIDYNPKYLGAKCFRINEPPLVNTAFDGEIIHEKDILKPVKHIPNSDKRVKYYRDLSDITDSISNIKYLECQGFDHFHPYKPQWVRYELDQRGKEIANSKCGLCPYCPTIKFFGLRNSGYMSHLAIEHGVYSNSYLVPDGLNFGEYQVGTSKHLALECPGCHQLVNVSCQKGKNELLNYFRHWRLNHKNSTITNLEVCITGKTRTTIPLNG